MSASFRLLKYTGYGAETEVTSIGFKRLDSVVAGSADAAVDDTGDVSYYQIYTPEIDDVTTASFESWFKLELVNPPDNQLSNIRLYADGFYTDNEYDASIKVGISQTFRKPTNSISDIATTDLSTYTKDSPLPITKDGLGGYEIDGDALTVYSYQITVNDTGSGNVFYLNNEKQKEISLVKGNTYIMNNTVGPTYQFRIFNSSMVELTDGITITNSGTNTETIEIDTDVLFDSLGTLDDIIYTTASNPTMGASIHLIDPSVISPNITKTMTVSIVNNEFYIDDVKKPVITFEPGNTYIFINPNGDTNPFRFFINSIGGSEQNVIVNGVSVVNGGTINEVVTVTTSDFFSMNGKLNLSYGSTKNTSYGNSVIYPSSQSGDASFPPITIKKGVYNMITAGDKTDFIVMQVQVNMNTTPGNFNPRIKIEWDES